MNFYTLTRNAINRIWAALNKTRRDVTKLKRDVHRIGRFGDVEDFIVGTLVADVPPASSNGDCIVPGTGQIFLRELFTGETLIGDQLCPVALTRATRQVENLSCDIFYAGQDVKARRLYRGGRFVITDAPIGQRTGVALVDAGAGVFVTFSFEGVDGEIRTIDARTLCAVAAGREYFLIRNGDKCEWVACCCGASEDCDCVFDSVYICIGGESAEVTAVGSSWDVSDICENCTTAILDVRLLSVTVAEDCLTFVPRVGVTFTCDGLVTPEEFFDLDPLDCAVEDCENGPLEYGLPATCEIAIYYGNAVGCSCSLVCTSCDPSKGPSSFSKGVHSGGEIIFVDCEEGWRRASVEFSQVTPTPANPPTCTEATGGSISFSVGSGASERGGRFDFDFSTNTVSTDAPGSVVSFPYVATDTYRIDFDYAAGSIKWFRNGVEVDSFAPVTWAQAVNCVGSLVATYTVAVAGGFCGLTIQSADGFIE